MFHICLAMNELRYLIIISFDQLLLENNVCLGINHRLCKIMQFFATKIYYFSHCPTTRLPKNTNRKYGFDKFINFLKIIKPFDFNKFMCLKFNYKNLKIFTSTAINHRGEIDTNIFVIL